MRNGRERKTFEMSAGADRVCRKRSFGVVQQIVWPGHDGAHTLSELHPSRNGLHQLCFVQCSAHAVCYQKHLIRHCSGRFFDFQTIALNLSPDEWLAVVYPGAAVLDRVTVKRSRPGSAAQAVASLEQNGLVSILLAITCRGYAGKTSANNRYVEIGILS